MPVPDVNLAPWADAADVCGPCADYDFDPVVLDRSLLLATEILYGLTGRQWPGSRLDRVRPCARAWTSDISLVPRGWSSTLDLSAGGYFDGWCGCHRERQCGCVHLSEVQLPEYPVTSIVSVTIDGAEVDPSDYRLDDDRYLVWVGQGTDRTGWPCCQPLDLPATEPDTFEIEYRYGQDPPDGGRTVAAILGCEFALSCGSPSQQGACRLPKRVSSITRQGVTIAILDNFGVFKDGLTGVPEVDMWLVAQMRGNRTQRATVILPDLARRMRRTDDTPTVS